MTKSPEDEHSQKVFGWAARDTSGVLSSFKFSRRVNRDNDITLDVLYCGICHSDLHSIKNELNNAVYPIVPGTQYGSRKCKW
ncbi:Alcohol dehydrogenase protein [Thalictrum thalictroides]|uniref:Alcohol dehydrogenase protein n=1 Tax=Thalictrum thalictroides TaxID=46969 RepID=A0A7J6WS96_THATH|nr:Alcohol dehydrogenase protein [Thalictrum thalictroides]